MSFLSALITLDCLLNLLCAVIFISGKTQSLEEKDEPKEKDEQEEKDEKEEKSKKSSSEDDLIEEDIEEEIDKDKVTLWCTHMNGHGMV